MMIFAFGSNGKGQLGIGDTNDQDTPRRCIFHYQRAPGSVVKITSGGNHTLVLFDSGRLFSAGLNDDGQAGPKSSDLDIVFTEVNLPGFSTKVKLCSATWKSTIVVTENDEIYTFGNGSNGELGTGLSKCRLPHHVYESLPPGTSVIDVASGLRHTVVILSNGEMYGWGSNRKGQLGDSEYEIIRTPKKVLGLPFPAKQATCGREFAYVVGDPAHADAHYFGPDKWGLGIDAPVMPWSPPLGRRMIGSSWCGISVLDISGKIVSWGRNDRGQLAPSGLPAIRNMAIGSEHSLALTESGQVLAWGWGEHGNCGSEVDETGIVKNGWREILLPSLSGDDKIVGLGAGCATSFVWTASDP